MANERVLQSAIQVIVTTPSNVRVLQSAIQILTIPGPMTAFCNNPPNGLVGQAYSQTFTVAGGISPFTWTLVSGTLPTGLTLNASTGVLSGTPSAAATYSFTLQVADSTGNTSQITCSITIGTAPAITCNSPQTGTVGVFYSHPFGLSGGTPPYTVTVIAGSLPPGLSFPAGTQISEGSPYIISTPYVMGGISFTAVLQSPYMSGVSSEAGAGIVAGIPTAPGTYTFTLLLTDALGNEATVTCSITIQGGGGSPCMTGGPG